MPILTLNVPLRTDANDNRRHIVARGRLISSSEYRSWKEAESEAIRLVARSARWKTLAGAEDAPIFVRIFVTLADRRSDHHNCMKGLLDCITESGAVWDDDKWVVPSFVPPVLGRRYSATVWVGTEPFPALWDAVTG